MMPRLGWVPLVLRLALALLFGGAALAKLFTANGPSLFAQAINAFEILPEHLVVLATFVFPWIELICAALLIAGLWTRSASLMLGILLLAFSGAIYSVIQRGMSVDCGCFGAFLPDALAAVLGQKTGWHSLIRNGVILSAILVVLGAGPGVLAVDNLLRRRPERPEPPDNSPS